MKHRLVIITNWIVVDNVSTPLLPNLATGESRRDITGQGYIPPDPNAVVWEVITPNFARYEADVNIYILSVEEIPDEIT